MDWLTKQKTYVWLIIILVVINLTTLILLWIDRPGSKQPPEHGPIGTDNFLKAELGLTDEQDKSMKESRDKFFEATRKIMDEIDQLKNQIRSEAFKKVPETLSVDSLTAKIGMLQSQTETLAFKHFTELSAILSPEQSKKFQEIFSKNRRPPHIHGENHPPEPPPIDGQPPR